MSKLDVLEVGSGVRTHDLNAPTTRPVLAELLQSHFLVVAHIEGDDAKVIDFDELRRMLTLADRSEVPVSEMDITAVAPASFKG